MCFIFLPLRFGGGLHQLVKIIVFRFLSPTAAECVGGTRRGHLLGWMLCGPPFSRSPGNRQMDPPWFPSVCKSRSAHLDQASQPRCSSRFSLDSSVMAWLSWALLNLPTSLYPLDAISNSFSRDDQKYFQPWTDGPLGSWGHGEGGTWAAENHLFKGTFPGKSSNHAFQEVLLHKTSQRELAIWCFELECHLLFKISSDCPIYTRLLFLFDLWVGKIPWRRKQPSISEPRSLAGLQSRASKKSQTQHSD